MDQNEKMTQILEDIAYKTNPQLIGIIHYLVEENTKLKNDIKNYQSEAEDYYSRSKRYIDAAKEEIKRLNIANKSLSDESSNYKFIVEKLNHQLKEKDSQIEPLKAKIKRLKEEVNSIPNQIDVARNEEKIELQDYICTYERFVEEYNRLKEELSSKDDIIRNYEEELANSLKLEKEKVCLENEKARLENELKQVRAQHILERNKKPQTMTIDGKMSLSQLESEARIIQYLQKREESLKIVQETLKQNPESRKIFIIQQLQEKILIKEKDNEIKQKTQEIEGLYQKIETLSKTKVTVESKYNDGNDSRIAELMEENQKLKMKHIALQKRMRSLFNSIKLKNEELYRHITQFGEELIDLRRMCKPVTNRMLDDHPIIKFFRVIDVINPNMMRYKNKDNRSDLYKSHDGNKLLASQNLDLNPESIYY